VTSALEVSLNDMRYINSRFTYLLLICRWHKPRREQYMTHEYFTSYQNEMTTLVCSENSDRDDARDGGHGSANNSGTDWIPLSEFNNRKNSSGGKKFILTLRQLTEKYLRSRAENVTEDDSSGLLADVNTDEFEL